MKSSVSVLSGLLLLASLGCAVAHAQEVSGQAPAPEQASEPAPTRDLGTIVAQPGGLTAQSVEARAVAASAALSEKRAELDVANARIAQTRIQFFPQLGVRASYMRLSPVETSLGNLVGAVNTGLVGVGPCPGNTTASCAVDSKGVPLGAAASKINMPENNYALSVSLSVPLSDYLFRISEAVASASDNRDAARHALQAEELKVRSDARVLYFNWLRTHGQVSIAEQAVQQANARLQEAQAAFDVGKLSRADLLQIQALVANARRAAQQAQNGRGLAGTQLSIVMDDAGGKDYVVGEEVPTLDAADTDLVADRKLLDAALARRLELRAMDDAAQSLSHGQSAMRVARAPRVDAVGQFDYANPNSRYFPPKERFDATWSVGLVASWNVTDAFVTNARIDELAAKRAAVLAQRESVVRGITTEIAMAQASVSDARAALQAGGTSLEAAQEGYRVATESFRLGQTTASFLVDAETDLLNARLALFNARIDLTTAIIRLEHALGRDAPNA